MAPGWKIAASATCVAALCGAAIFWLVHREKAIDRKLAEDARILREQGERGDAKAQFNLGKMYFQGHGVPRDYVEAVRWYRKAAEQGDAKAQNNLALMYSQGVGVPLDYAEAVRWYRKAAGQGDARSQYGLGFMLHQGLGAPQDSAEAVRWCRAAADQGYPMAQYAVGLMYRFGQGAPQDYAEAVRWYRKAADQGDEEAQMSLAYLYYHGQGVPRNYALAARWLGKVAAACFRRTQEGPLERSTAALVILLGVFIVGVPLRRWERCTWVPSALTSVLCAAALAHELLLSPSALASLDRVLPGIIFSGLGRVLWLSSLAGCSAIFAIGAVREAVRGSSGASAGGLRPSAIP
jgi:TPR repeat protein